MGHGWHHNLDNRGGHYLLLIGVAGWLFFVNLGTPSLWDLDEGRNATCSWSMREAGNWIVPTFNGRLRVDKPVLLYWLQIACYETLGVHEWSARLPSALAALLTLLVAYELGRSLFSARAGLLAGLMVAATPMQCCAARFANPDALLQMFTTMTLWVFWTGLPQPRRRWWVALGTLTGLAVLTKGPVGLLLPGAVIFAFLVWSRQLRVLLDRRLLLAIGVFLLVALPWYAWVAAETKGQFLKGFLGKHNVNRFLSTMEEHNESPFYYLIVLAVGTAPWSIFFPMAAWFSLRAAWGKRGEGETTTDTPPAPANAGPANAHRFLWCWIGVYLVFFSLSATKLPNYILPTVVPACLLVARLMETWSSGAAQVPAWALRWAMVCLLLMGACLALGLGLVGGVVELPGMKGRHIAALGPWAWCGLLPLSAGLGGWLLLRRERRRAFVRLQVGVSLVLFGLLAAWAPLAADEVKPARYLVASLDDAGHARDIRLACFQMECLPSINFYSHRLVAHFQDDQEVIDFLRSPLPAYLFVPEREWRQLARNSPASVRVIDSRPDLQVGGQVLLVTNR